MLGTLLTHLYSVIPLLLWQNGLLKIDQKNGPTQGIDALQDALQEDEPFAKSIASFRFIKCNYRKHNKPEEFLYETLSQGLGFHRLYVS